MQDSKSVTKKLDLRIHQFDSMKKQQINECPICRICYADAENGESLLSPCQCKGSLRFVHEHCLEMWIKTSLKKTCDVCKYEYEIRCETLPLLKWTLGKIDKADRNRFLEDLLWVLQGLVNFYVAFCGLHEVSNSMAILATIILASCLVLSWLKLFYTSFYFYRKMKIRNSRLIIENAEYPDWKENKKE